MHYVRSSRLFVLWNGLDWRVLSHLGAWGKGTQCLPIYSSCAWKSCQLWFRGRWKRVLGSSRGGPGISHLFFTDDVLLFYNGKMSQVCVVVETINEFYNMSGLRINFDKSKAMASKCIIAWKKESLTSFTSICFTCDIGKYLGILLLKGRV